MFAALTGHAAYERRSGEQVVAQFLRIATEPVPDLRHSNIPDDIAALEVRHDTLTVPAGVGPAVVKALAGRKAQSQVSSGERISFVPLHGSRPASGSSGSEMEWRYSYHVIPSAGTAEE